MFQPQVHALSTLILKRHSKCQHSGGELRVCFTATALYSRVKWSKRGPNWIMHQHNDCKHSSKSTTEVIEVVGQAADLNPTEI